MRPYNVAGEWRAIPGGLIWCRPISERNRSMIDRYRSGETLDAIGKSHGISRERVRQILRRAGMSGADGGARVMAQRSADARQSRRDARYLRKYGVAFADYRVISSADAVRPYSQQRKNARDRGIEWHFTLGSWWRCWQDSGKWSLRGRAADKFVMARIGDAGPYSPANIYFTTLAGNTGDYQRHRRERAAAQVAA